MDKGKAVDVNSTQTSEKPLTHSPGEKLPANGLDECNLELHPAGAWLPVVLPGDLWFCVYV